MGKKNANSMNRGAPKLKTGTLPALLATTARRFPKRTALIYFGQRIAYKQLAEQVERCAAGLQALGSGGALESRS